ncbi:MAG TPA: hypothetical protein VMS56_04015 [Thermoanaerobaculia bacterium]|nr:hypothetical protein [Thermoanaerobaculia bacterium]
MRSSRAAIGLIVAAHLAAAVALTPGFLEPDSVATFAWIRSLVLDGDFLFYDEWAGFGMIVDGIPLYKEVTRTGALANHWWVGTSIVTAPFYLAAHLAASLGGSPNGFTGLYALTLAWTSVLFGAAACAIAFSLMHGRSIPPAAALGAIALVWLGTPMFWYEMRFPLGTHLAGIACIGALTLVLARVEREPDRALDLLAGLLLGLAIVTRLQHLMLAPAVALHLWRSGRGSKGLSAAAIGAALPLAVQGAAWHAVYGQPLGPLLAGSSPMGGTWMAFRTIALDEVLLSSWHGLLPWSPVAALAIAGWVLELRRSRLAAAMLLMFAGEWIANGLFDRYFWGGLSFGPRRFVDLAVPLMLGLGWLLRRSGVAGWIAAAAATAWTVLLTFAAAGGSLPLDRDVLPRELFAAVGSIDWSGLARALFGASALVRAPTTTLGALAIVVAVAAALAPLARRARRGAIALVVLCTLSLAAALAAIAPTRARAEEQIRRFRIDRPAAAAAGPLIDARGLLAHELEFLRRRGRERQAAETERTIREIDRRLDELGVGLAARR